MASDAEHFFMSMGPLYVLLGELSTQVHCPFFNWIVCLPGVELYEFFIYFGDQTIVCCVLGKYVLPYSRFPGIRFVKAGINSRLGYYSYTVEYYSAIKRNAILKHSTTQMSLENFMISERSQTQSTP